MQNLVAKFVVLSVVAFEGGVNVTLQPVMSGSEENKSFSTYTPSGRLEMSITNPHALEFFKEGNEHLINFNNAAEKDLTKAQTPELTFGQESVGLSFNPSGDPLVNRAKQLSADLIDLVEDKMALSTWGGEKGVESRPSWRTNVLRTAAFNALIAAQMAVVKFLTWSGK